MPRQTLRGRGSVELRSPPEATWNALLDPGVLRATIPGALGVEQLDAGRYRATIAFGVGWVTGRYTAELTLANMRRPVSLELSGQSKGAFGKGEATAQVELVEAAAGGCRLDWRYQGVVSGPVSFAGRTLLQIASDLFIQRFFAAMSRSMSAFQEQTSSPGVFGSLYTRDSKAVLGA